MLLEISIPVELRTGKRYNKSMQTVFIIGFVVIGAVLTCLASMRPRRSVLSRFELERRKEQGNEGAADELRRECMLDDVMSLRRVLEALFVVFMVMSSVAAFGPIIGVVVALAVALMYGRIAQLEFVHNVSQRAYEQIEPGLLDFIEKHPQVSKVLKSVTTETAEPIISSREEFAHLVQRSNLVLSPDERNLIVNSLEFDSKTVEQIMTPRGVVETVSATDVLGPLLLDELHRTGHSRFPVIDGDIDHVVGTLHIKDLLTLRDKDTETADKAMDKKVYYINQDQNLKHALNAFIKSRHHLFIVVNGYRETVGIVTLENVMEALLGHKIVDEFDLHDDLRTVAERNSKTNNNPPDRTDV